MAEKKNTGSDKPQTSAEKDFDDLEDAFFASGDAVSFWETADAVSYTHLTLPTICSV